MNYIQGKSRLAGHRRGGSRVAWLLQHSPTILLIPGISSVMHLHENMAAGEITLRAEPLEERERTGTR